MQDQVMSVRVPKDLAEAAKEKASKDDLTLAQIIRRALRAYIDQWKSQMDEQAGE